MSCKDEYLDASANMRHYGNMRFAQLTLFSGYTAGLLTIVFGTQGINVDLKIAFSVFALIVSLVFLIMEERSATMFHTYRMRAEFLEQELGFSQHSSRLEANRINTLITSANAVRLLYVSIFLGWLFVLWYVE